jgi:hypothetical protein
VFDSRLHKAKCREIRIVSVSWLHEGVYIQRYEMSLTVGYMTLCVDRYMKCGRKLVT